jgi:hypothetical protein
VTATTNLTQCENLLNSEPMFATLLPLSCDRTSNAPSLYIPSFREPIRLYLALLDETRGVSAPLHLLNTMLMARVHLRYQTIPAASE